MGKIFVQSCPSAFSFDSSLAAAGSTSGSFSTMGYAMIGGMAYASASLSTIRLYQSIDGTNWDYWQDFALAANSGSVYSASISGKYGQIAACGGATASATNVRIYFYLRPV